MKETIAIIAAGLAVVGNVPYILKVFKKEVEPHPYTWFVWTIVSGTVVFGQIAKGAGVGVIPTIASEIFTLIIFLFSLRYGFRNIRRIDTYFLIAALLGLIPWILTKDPTISVVVVVTIDLIAFVPTLRKTWNKPRTEAPILYTTNFLRHGMALFALEAYNLATMLHSIVMIIVNILMTFIIVYRRSKTKVRSR